MSLKNRAINIAKYLFTENLEHKNKCYILDVNKPNLNPLNSNDLSLKEEYDTFYSLAETRLEQNKKELIKNQDTLKNLIMKDKKSDLNEYLNDSYDLIFSHNGSFLTLTVSSNEVDKHLLIYESFTISFFICDSEIDFNFEFNNQKDSVERDNYIHYCAFSSAEEEITAYFNSFIRNNNKEIKLIMNSLLQKKEYETLTNYLTTKEKVYSFFNQNKLYKNLENLFKPYGRDNKIKNKKDLIDFFENNQTKNYIPESGELNLFHYDTLIFDMNFDIKQETNITCYEIINNNIVFKNIKLSILNDDQFEVDHEKLSEKELIDFINKKAFVHNNELVQLFQDILPKSLYDVSFSEDRESISIKDFKEQFFNLELKKMNIKNFV